MKHLCFILFALLSSGKILSQDTVEKVFHLDSLPVQGILLDKGWKFHVGDNPDWARPDFDDSKWEDIEPTLDIYRLPQIKKEPVVISIQ